MVGFRPIQWIYLCGRMMTAPGQLAQRRKLRAAAQEAMLQEGANSKFRCLLACNQTFQCTEVGVGNSVVFYKRIGRKSAPKWRGHLGTIGSGVAVRFESQTFKVAGSCVPKRQEPQGVASVDPDGPRVSLGSGAIRTLWQVAGLWMAALCLVWM